MLVTEQDFLASAVLHSAITSGESIFQLK